jgi:hypothetical protein
MRMGAVEMVRAYFHVEASFADLLLEGKPRSVKRDA